MGSENPTPLEELQRLDQQIDQVNELAELKPIFYRLEEIAKEHGGDFEVQLMVGDVKQHVVNRGTRLKQQQQPPVEPPQAAAPPPAPAPVSTTAAPLDLSTPALRTAGQFELPKVTPPPPLSEPAAPAAKPSKPVAMPPPLPTWASQAAQNTPPPPGPISTETLSTLLSPRAVQPEQGAPPPPEVAASKPVATTAPLVTGENASPSVPTPPVRGGGSPPRMPPPKRPGDFKRAALIGGLIGVIAAIIIIVVLVNIARTRNRVAGAVDVAITTIPAGASVRLNGEELCVSDCTAQLAPGTHQLTAVLDGYDPSVSEVTITAGRPASVSLALLAQPQTLRVFADLAQGAVVFDGQAAGALQDGQFTLENVMPGFHTVRVTGGASEATFSFEMAEARLPMVTGSVSTRNLLAILVTTFSRQARVTASSGPLKLALNGQPQGDAGPAGVDLANYQPGVAEMVLGEGNQLRTFNESFGPGPALTAFLKTDQNIGTLIVATNQNDVRVFLNDREQPRRTARGQLRVQTIGRQVVRVAKEGFEELPPQIATVVSGSEARLTFNLKALPEFSSLAITGGTPEAEVLIDDMVVGTIGADGGFRHSSVSPGDRVIEIRRPRYEPKRFERTFRRGQPVTLNGADPVLVAIREPPPPEPEPPPPPKPEPPPVKVVQAPKPRTGGIANFDNPAMWREQDGIWRHRGEAHLTFGMLPANGVFTFSIYLVRGGNLFRGGRVRWFLDYQDNRNYAFFELDDENFWVKDVVNGRTTERAKVAHGVGGSQRAWSMQIDVSPTRAIHRIQRAGEWVVLDTWTDAQRDFSDGKFGILVNGEDEVGLSDFRFTGR